MFGNVTAGSNGSHPPSQRPRASDVAQINGILTQVIVGPEFGDGVQIFTNGAPLPPGVLESLTVTITAPESSGGGGGGGITGILSRYSGDTHTGETPASSQQSAPLFPGTVEFIARGRRVVVTCVDENSFEGLWLGLGLRDDGTSTELLGVRSLTITVTPTLLDARLIWSEDGAEEDILPEL